MNSTIANAGCEDDEIDELVQTVYAVYGYDFRNYEKLSRKRRVMSFMNHARIDSIAAAARQIAGDTALFRELLDHLTVNTTELFRDSAFFLSFVKEVVPVLRSHATFKVWHAGCSTGEEVYSMVILLHEMGLLERAVVYATDVDRTALEKARKGIVPSRVLKRDARNYFDAGLKHSLHDYWHTRHGYGLLNPRLLDNVVFCEHNLVTDASFGEMHVILCRNVLIYFGRALQDRVLGLLVGSLARGGFLCLGSAESVRFSSAASELDEQSRDARIYRGKTRL